MINIGLLLIPNPTYGGVYQYSRTIIEACKKIEQYKFTIYTTHDNHFYNDLGIEVKYIKSTKKSWVSLILKNLLGINATEPFGNEDMILASTHSPILLHTKKPFVFTLHDLQEYYYPQNFSLPKKIWRRFINRSLCKKAKYIVCESNYVKNDISTFFAVNNEKIIVNPAPPIIDKYERNTDAEVQKIVQKYDLPQKYFFYPAQFWKHKNHTKLLMALHSLQNNFGDISLVFTGKKAFEFNNVIQLSKELNINHLVQHIGYVDQKDLPIIYKNSIALILPTLFESISIPIYEAFNLGVPVCCSNVVSLPEQVGNAALLFNPNDALSIADSMSTLLKDPALGVQLARLGKERMELVSLNYFSTEISHLILLCIKH